MHLTTAHMGSSAWRGASGAGDPLVSPSPPVRQTLPRKARRSQEKRSEMTLKEGEDKDMTDDEVDVLVRAAVSDTRRLQTAALDRSERTSKKGVKGQISTTSNQTPAINRLSQETATQLHDKISPSYSQPTVDQSNTQTNTHKQTHTHRQTDTQSIPAVAGSPQTVQDLK